MHYPHRQLSIGGCGLYCRCRTINVVDYRLKLGLVKSHGLIMDIAGKITFLFYLYEKIKTGDEWK